MPRVAVPPAIVANPVAVAAAVPPPDEPLAAAVVPPRLEGMVAPIALPHEPRGAAAVPPPRPEDAAAPAMPAEIRVGAPAALYEAQAAVTRGCAALATELNTLSRASHDAAANSLLAVLAAKSPAEIARIHSTASRTGLDLVIAWAAKCSEIGARMASETTRPLLARLDPGDKTRALGV